MAVKLKTGRSATYYHTPQVHFLYRRFNVTDVYQAGTTADIVNKHYLGVLPAHALPLETYVRVNVACTANNIIVGTSSDIDAAVTTADVLGATTGLYVVDRYTGTYSSEDTALYIATITTGSSTGQVDVWQAYLPAHPAT